MYLKRLDIYGFKTFADRTELEFGPGITAIVGPNGSGKSNISDAILWVLGEQGMKALRSAKSVDVIFNGSDARKALGMAEVNLTLDNSSGVLPLDFSEITVSRRVFRSGESEYLINRTPVRMRDVHDLFMDTGIGKQSYSMISQGEVDAVLSSRSEERRALFEEAAGITKYKHRKKETLRKLEQTRQNLLRVSDIISELSGQVEPLAEQCEKAKAYQVFNEELTSLQLSLLVAQYSGLQGSMARSREREAELQKELEGLRHALQQAEIKEAAMRAELQALEDELEERRQVENRFAGAVQAAENSLAMLKQQESNTRNERDRLEQERTEFARQFGHFDEEIAAAEAEQARLREVIAALEAEIVEAESAIKEADSAVGALMAQIQERRGAYLDILDQAARARNELTRVESLLRNSESRRERISAEADGLRKSAAERREGLSTAQKSMEERISEREKINAQRADAARARQAMTEKQASLRKDENAAREELASSRARQRTLQELEDSLEGYFPGVRAVAAAVMSGQLSGWFAPVSDLLEVPAELETAIEVALGADLQNIVTDTEQDARAAITLLKSSRAGRATFMPLDLISPAPRAYVPSLPGVLGLAMDLITFEPACAAVAQQLLGRVIVTQDMDSALALAKSQEAKGWNRIVTLEGEIIHPSRAITGGSLGKGSGLLKRKRELQELTATVEQLEGRVVQLAKKAQETAAELQRLDAEVNNLAKASEKAAAGIAEAERTVATIQRDVVTLDERLAALEQEAQWLAQEATSAKEEEAKHQEALQALELEQKTAESSIEDAEKALVGGRQEREGVAEKFSALRLRWTEARGQFQAQQSAARRAAELRDSLAERMAKNTASMDSLETQIADLAAQQQTSVAELLRLREAYARSTGDLDAAKTRRTAFLEGIAAHLEEQKAGRERIEECQGRLHRAQLRSTQVETELGFIEGQFFEDYRMTPDQAMTRAVPVENRGAAVTRLKELQACIEELGAVNLGAIDEFTRVTERLEYLTKQRQDLEEGRDSLIKVIAEIDTTCKEKFLEAFANIAREFQDLFVRLFGGGNTQLTLIDPTDVLETGIDINVVIPGKRNQNLVQLSGGERALTALALLFAMLRVKPSPFVVLDEIDAPLDEANVGRYCDVLRDFTADTQFLIVTHNKGTMEAADVLYGVTMEKAGVSKIVSVRLADHHRPLASVSGQNGPYANESRVE